MQGANLLDRLVSFGAPLGARDEVAQRLFMTRQDVYEEGERRSRPDLRARPWI